MGKVFFKDLYNSLNLNIFEYTFDEHDETVAYSLSIPFVSTFVFAAVMKHQEAPGTTFKKHMAIAKGLLSEDDYLLQEILFNPRTPSQVENIRTELKQLLEIITNKDAEGMKKYLTKIREKINDNLYHKYEGVSSFITDIPSPFFSNSRDKQNVKMIIRSAQFSFFSPKGKARRKKRL